ncbi:acetylxylan esterase [Chryseolinea sp. T2]|uniref:acetylxylan esterase n=1 Tax=Chryseolinea sp. T2 TaxID=3129255 RepID=UPI003077B7BC
MKLKFVFRNVSATALLMLVLIACLQAQPVEQFVKVVVAPERADWTYKTGEPVTFTITVLQNGNPLHNVAINYQVGPEKMEPTIKKEGVAASKGTLSVNGGTMKTAGFLRCTAEVTVDGKIYKGLGTAGFDPLSIRPTVADKSDFNAFWDQAKKDLATIPLDARMTLMPERCTETVNVYHVNIQNFRIGARVYGILCVPKKDGKYPALLRVPGAGVRPYAGDVAMAEKGIITLEIGIHGIPVNMDPGVYNDLRAGALADYNTYNLDNRDRYYYKRVYLGCVRANDFLFSLPQFDGTNLAVTGGSQGGALSIVTAALDPRVKFLAAFYPALSDVTGYLNGRAGGWPHLFNKDNVAVHNIKEKLETVPYYDVVNFARTLKVPGLYSWGFNDETCPPTSMYAAYNVITAPKELMLALETGHWTYPEQRDKFNAWLEKKLKN